ncbi:MAG: hypothetical protein M3541_23795 [Acidobacteriota bacterium]|nr:hypothetical protein [Acidobacteriota bacterium]
MTVLNPYYAQLCCVIAADPGAGKTIIAELLIKELMVLVTCSDASSSDRELPHAAVRLAGI